jgi:hypothetical protein
MRPSPREYRLGKFLTDRMDGYPHTVRDANHDALKGILVSPEFFWLTQT